MKFGILGPTVRPSPPQKCACGLLYGRYKFHKETKHHKDAMRRWRREEREAREQQTA